MQTLVFDHPLVKVVNWRPRPKTLGACRNLAVKHATKEVVLVWDDDDRYRHDHIRRMVNSLGDKDAVKVNGFLVETGKGPVSFQKRGPMNQIAFRRKLFNLAGGYPEIDTGEDRELFARLLRVTAVPEVFRRKDEATFTYNNSNTLPHVSWNSDYKSMGKRSPSVRGTIDLSTAFKLRTNPRINIVTNITNGAGLQRHAGILADRLRDLGADVHLVHYDDSNTWGPADLSVHVEHLRSGPLQLAPLNWFMPMPEWYHPDHWDGMLPAIDKVLCNTKHGVQLFRSRCRPTYVGFESLDKNDPTVPRERKFLHVAGRSINKNTKSVLEAWTKYNIPFDLTVIAARDDIAPAVKHPRVTVLRRLDDTLLNYVLNNHLFHICVSKYEGWGHYLHEAHSVGGLTITHNQPPLNEFHATARVEARKIGTMRLAPIFEPVVSSLAETVLRCGRMTDDEIQEASAQARDAFERERAHFRSALHKVYREALV